MPGGQGVRVLLVRHAQSQNNIVQAAVQAKIKAGMSPQQAQAEWLSARHDDPDLSPDGYDQLSYLRMFSKRLPTKTGCKTFKIYTSPMRRACATAKCVEEGLGDCRTFCMPELVEVGGMYHAQQDAQGNWSKGRGTALTAAQIQQEFQFNVSNLAQSGPWDGGRGFETTAEALVRAQELAKWLLTEAIKKEHSLEGQVPDCIVIVSHADFLALLLAALNKMDAEGAHDNPDFDVSVHGVTVPDVPDVSVHGTTEQGLYQAGGLPVVVQANGSKDVSGHKIPFRQRAEHISQTAIDDAANVYKRFRISLACTTLLQMKPNGKIKTVWMNKRDHLDVM
eukprot:Tamp_20951.p1 GENE.Tamp_20951~~Tamp_20951.p1  ORF type:complete len:344 (+),score=53.72 Tamp_20951:25-1032(+)